jgi:hypothetical protein
VASRRPSAERNPTRADFVVMNGAPAVGDDDK